MESLNTFWFQVHPEGNIQTLTEKDRNPKSKKGVYVCLRPYSQYSGIFLK